jgi:hypothetical protein
VLNSQPQSAVTVVISTPAQHCAIPALHTHVVNASCAITAECESRHGIGAVCVPAAEGVVTPSVVVFTSANWSTPVTVSVTAVDDKYTEGGSNGVHLTHTLVSLDPEYDSTGECVEPGSNSTCAVYVRHAPEEILVAVIDNDAVAIALSTSTVAITEGGAAANYTVVLTAQPLMNVTVTLDADTAQVKLSVSSLVFSPSTWNTPQHVTVVAVDDHAVETAALSVHISHNSSSVELAGSEMPTLVATVTDNDVASVVNNMPSTPLYEGEAGTPVTFTLTAQPEGLVTVTLSPPAGVLAAPASFSISPSQWDTGVTVTLTADDDFVARGNSTGAVTISTASADSHFDSLPLPQRASVSVSTVDNDVAGLVLDALVQPMVAAEGGVTTYTVRLQSQPLHYVTVTATVMSATGTVPASGVVVSPPTVALDDSNWDTGAVITVSAPQDLVAWPRTAYKVVHTLVSDDDAYQALTVSAPALRWLAVEVVDDDLAGLDVSPGVLAMTENAATTSATYTAALHTQPQSTVEVYVSVAAGEEGIQRVVVTPNKLTFTVSNWADPQVVNVTVRNDDVDQGSVVVYYVNHTVQTSADTVYVVGSALTATQVSVTDDDGSGVAVSVGELSLVESDGASVVQRYSLRLTSDPVRDVQVTPTSPDLGVQFAVRPTHVVFTSANWSVSTNVSVWAVDDDSDRRSTPVRITHDVTSATASYNGIDVTSIAVLYTDNDVAGVSLAYNRLTTLQAVDGTSSMSMFAALSSQPLSPVTITPVTTPRLKVVLTPASVVIQPQDWRTPAAFTIALNATAQLTNIPQNVTVTFAVAADDDAQYSAVAAPTANVLVSTGRNDPPVASAGPDRVVVSAGQFAQVLLDGVASQDPEARPLKFLWSQVSGPTPAMLGDATTPYLNVTRMRNGTYEFSLKVTDDAGQSSEDAVVVSVPALLHVAASDSVFTSAGECYSGRTCALSWTTVGVAPSEVTVTAYLTVDGDAPVELASAIAQPTLSTWSNSTAATATVTWRVPATTLNTTASFSLFVNATFPTPQLVLFSRTVAVPVRQLFSLQYSNYSACSAACGQMGTRTRTATCVGSANASAPQPLSACDPAAHLSLACAGLPCVPATSAAYQWSVTSDWAACSAACGGGISRRNVSCTATAGGAVVAATECAGAGAMPDTSRACNTRACVTLSYAVAAWGPCDTACGGTRARVVQCMSSSSTAGDAATAVDMSRCSAAIGPPPPATEVCRTCSFCETTACSGHGTCANDATTCSCSDGYSGRVCELWPGCNGPTAGSGECCPTGSILTADDECCAPVVGSAAAPALDIDGGCCASGVVNRCGVCDGPAAAAIAVTGTCCTNGVLDADGLCCASGVVDSLGVCDGGDATGKQVVAVALEAPAGFVEADLTDSSKTRDLDAALTTVVAESLNRSPSQVVVVGYSSSRRLLAQAAASHGPRGLLAGITATFDLLPTGSANNVPVSELSARLAGARSSSLVNVLGVLSAHMAAVCNNSVCESGERPNVALGVAGCPDDCRYPVASCPTANGAACNGVGICASDESGVATCRCSAARGYSGDACEVCATGFVSDAGSCIRVEAAELGAIINAPSKSSGAPGAVIGAVFAGVGFLVLAAVAVKVVKHVRSKKNATPAVVTWQLSPLSKDRKSSRVAVDATGTATDDDMDRAAGIMPAAPPAEVSSEVQAITSPTALVEALPGGRRSVASVVPIRTVQGNNSQRSPFVPEERQ